MKNSLIYHEKFYKYVVHLPLHEILIMVRDNTLINIKGIIIGFLANLEKQCKYTKPFSKLNKCSNS